MVEWIRTLLNLVAERRLLGESWGRLAIILGLVAIITGGSALIFFITVQLEGDIN